MSQYYEIIKAANKRLTEYKQFADEIMSDRGILFKSTRPNGELWVGVKAYNEIRAGTWKRISAKKVISSGININNLPEYQGFNEKHRNLAWNYGLKFSSNLASQAYQKSKDEIKRVEYILYAKRRELYDAYILTNDWFKKRDKCFSVHGFMCKDCRKAPAIDIHHRHYESLGNECVENDLVPLCRNCHKARHDSNSLMDKPE